MRELLSQLKPELQAVLRTIGREADGLKMPAYLVGGAVRDILLGYKSLDLDIVVEGNAPRLAKRMAQIFNTKATVYAEFGTATVWHGYDFQVDFVTARKESYARPGALPSVSDGTLKDDLFRRDFTVNAMALQINPGRFSELIDFYGGLIDVQRKRIRVLHDASFTDDPTRILRAVRFATRLNFRIEAKTLAQLRSALSKKVEESVKLPRYFHEFQKTLSEVSVTKHIRRLEVLGALRYLFPGLVLDYKSLSRLERSVKKLSEKPEYEKASAWIYPFLALISRADLDRAAELVQKFQLSKSDVKTMMQAQDDQRWFDLLSRKGLNPSDIYTILESLTRDAVVYLRMTAPKKVIKKRIDLYMSDIKNTKLQINGHDVQRLGVPSGAKVGAYLKKVLMKKMDGQIKTKKQELDLVRALIKQRSS